MPISSHWDLNVQSIGGASFGASVAVPTVPEVLLAEIT